MAVGDVIPMPAPKRPEPANDIDQMDAVARAKLQISEIVWYMPPEEALGILADIALRVIRKTFDGEDAVGQQKYSVMRWFTPSSKPTASDEPKQGLCYRNSADIHAEAEACPLRIKADTHT
jgi:hypothetical protein